MLQGSGKYGVGCVTFILNMMVCGANKCEFCEGAVPVSIVSNARMKSIAKDKCQQR